VKEEADVGGDVDLARPTRPTCRAWA